LAGKLPQVFLIKMILIFPLFNLKRFLGLSISGALCVGLVNCSERHTENTKTSSSPETLIVEESQFTTDTIPSKMVWIPGGTFQMGTVDRTFADAQPVHQVMVDGFWMDEHEVTNAEFAAFVKTTNYITVAERPLNPADFPGIPVENLIPGSGVFTPPSEAVPLDNVLQWWRYIPGASWRHPTGPSSTLKGQQNKPVVHVCYEDAVAYAKWTGKRLPTEAEWEYAAQAGKGLQKYYWGNELKPNGKWVANIYQGNFPNKNTGEDGHMRAAPVKSYPANAFGLYDMEGNVWEWCHDLYRPDYYLHSPAKNPQGPQDSYDPDEPDLIKRVQRGGSFLCSDQYCIRYKPGSRGKGEVSSASDNLGFRCVKDGNPPKKS